MLTFKNEEQLKMSVKEVKRNPDVVLDIHEKPPGIQWLPAQSESDLRKR